VERAAGRGGAPCGAGDRKRSGVLRLGGWKGWGALRGGRPEGWGALWGGRPEGVKRLAVHKQEMGHNGSRGRPESVAPEFLFCRRTEVNISPPKVVEISSLPTS
jgi:hypothetical protein